MTFDEFIEALYQAGWIALMDAQHNNIVKLWEELRDKGIRIPLTITEQ